MSIQGCLLTVQILFVHVQSTILDQNLHSRFGDHNILRYDEGSGAIRKPLQVSHRTTSALSMVHTKKTAVLGM